MWEQLLCTVPVSPEPIPTCGHSGHVKIDIDGNCPGEQLQMQQLATTLQKEAGRCHSDASKPLLHVMSLLPVKDPLFN
jgi:hypothetical protein